MWKWTIARKDSFWKIVEWLWAIHVVLRPGRTRMVAAEGAQ